MNSDLKGKAVLGFPLKLQPLVLAVILIMLFCSGAGIVTWFQNQARKSKFSERIIPVKTQPVVAATSYKIMQTYTGEVAALRTSDLGFERSGRIVRINVDRGDYISVDNPIATLDTSNLNTERLELIARRAQALAVLEALKAGPRTEEIATAQFQVRELEILLKLENIKSSRRRVLYLEGAISREQYDEVAFNRNALSQRLAAAASHLKELMAGTRQEEITAQQAVVRQLNASISNVEIVISKSTIKAPFSGIISARRLDEGVIVSASQPVVRLVEITSPEVEIGVPIQITPQIQLDSFQVVQIGSNKYRAKVTAILPEASPITRTSTVVLVLDRSIGQSITVGQVAQLVLPKTVAINGYWLPISALIPEERGLWSCYVLAEVNPSSEQPTQKDKRVYRVEKKLVEVLHTESDRILVRGTLTPEDIFISAGIHRILPGQLVRSIESHKKKAGVSR